MTVPHCNTSLYSTHALLPSAQFSTCPSGVTRPASQDWDLFLTQTRPLCSYSIDRVRSRSSDLFSWKSPPYVNMWFWLIGSVQSTWHISWVVWSQEVCVSGHYKKNKQQRVSKSCRKCIVHFMFFLCEVVQQYENKQDTESSSILTCTLYPGSNNKQEIPPAQQECTVGLALSMIQLWSHVSTQSKYFLILQRDCCLRYECVWAPWRIEPAWSGNFIKHR